MKIVKCTIQFKDKLTVKKKGQINLMKIRTSICFFFQYVVYQKPGEIMEVLILIKLTARFDCCELTLGFNA